MKKPLLILAILIIFAGNTFSQWITQYTDLNSNFNTIQFLTASTGYLVGQKSVSPNDAVVMKSTNGGANWQALPFSVPGRPPINDLYFVDASTGYLCGESQNIYKTTDGGVSWTYTTATTQSGMSFEAIYFVNALTGFSAGFSGITVKTTNGGTNWTTLSSGTSDVHTIYFVNATTGFRGDNSGGFYKTTNAGTNWVYSLVTDSNSVVYSLECIKFIDANTGYMSGSKSSPARGVIYKTTNGGANWKTVFITNYNITGVFATSTTDAYAVGYATDVFKTSNGGASWFTQNLSLSIPNSASVFFLNTTTGYVVEDGVVFKTTNGGAGSETHTISGFVRYNDNSQPVIEGLVKAIRLDRNTGNILVLDSAQIQSNGSYFLPHVPQDTVDIGVYPNSTTTNDWVITYYPSTIYWQNVTQLYPTTNLTNINIYAIRMINNSVNNSVNGKVMRLTDVMLGNLKDAIVYAKSGNSFVRFGVSDNNGVYHLPSLPSGPLKLIVNRLGFTGDSITVNVSPTTHLDSINFYLNRVYVGIIKISSEIPGTFILYQNYPNPFNPVTKIEYDIPQNISHSLRAGQLVKLSVFDILGKEVAALVNENQSPGKYRVTFDGRGLPSGVYYYKLETNGLKNVRPMILLK